MQLSLRKEKCKIISIVGKSDGYVYENSNVSIHIKVEKKKLVNAYIRNFSSLSLALVSHTPS